MAACATLMTIRSLSCRVIPDAEKLAAPVRSARPSISQLYLLCSVDQPNVDMFEVCDRGELNRWFQERIGMARYADGYE
jgi:hypothetical protein